MLRAIQQELEREVRTETYAGLYREFIRECAHAAKFAGWAELVASFHSRTEPPQVEDAILRDLFTCHARDQNPLWRDILTLAFFPALVWVFGQRRSWSRRPEELWSNLHWAFLQSVLRFDVCSRPTGIFRRICGDVCYRLRRLYEKKWRRSRREVAAGDLVYAPDRHDDVDLDPSLAAERHDGFDGLVRNLRALVVAGAISEDDLNLVLETRVQGVALHDAASVRGIAYQTAVMRRKRAEAAIRRSLEDGEKKA